LKEYILKFSRLENGEHIFEYQVDDTFFKSFNESRIESGKLKVKVKLVKTSMVFTLFFIIKGSVQVACSRCLEMVELPIKVKNKLYLKFGAVPTDISDVDEIMILQEHTTEIDLRQHIFEFISLGIPFRVTHSENTENQCNPEMIKKLESYLVKEKEPNIDPRWEVLKKLQNN